VENHLSNIVLWANFNQSDPATFPFFSLLAEPVALAENFANLEKSEKLLSLKKAFSGVLCSSFSEEILYSSDITEAIASVLTS